MKAIPLMAALVGIVAITGCSGGKPPQVVYEGDHPEAAKIKAHATCLAAAFEAAAKVENSLASVTARHQMEQECNKKFGNYPLG